MYRRPQDTNQEITQEIDARLYDVQTKTGQSMDIPTPLPLNVNERLTLVCQCDETRPCCKECQRKRLDCGYSKDRLVQSPGSDTTKHPGKDSLAATSTSRSNSPENILSLNFQSSNPASIPESELARHYHTHTMQFFTEISVCGEHADTWRALIPALALDSLAVRRGMLTLAAICMHYDSVAADPSGHSWQYLETAEAHGIVFVTESRKILQDLHESESELAFACSILLCILGFAFFRAHRRNGVTLGDRAAWTWLQLLRGVKSTHIGGSQPAHGVHGVLAKNMSPDSELAQHSGITAVPCTESNFTGTLIRFIRYSQHERFNALRSTIIGSRDVLGEYELEDLSAAVDTLQKVTEQTYSQPIHDLFRTICTWPSDIPKGFADMLISTNPLALAVYAHWLMLVVVVKDLWWVNDMGRAGIRNVIDACDGADSHVRTLLHWPRLMLDTDINPTNQNGASG